MNNSRSRSNSGGRLKTPSKDQTRIRSVSGGRKAQLNLNLNGSLFAGFQSEEDLSDVSKIKVKVF